MTSTGTVNHDGNSVLRRMGRSRSVRLVAATMAAGLTVGALASTGAAADAATTYSPSASGRFLSGTIATLNLDSVAGVEGESATNNYGAAVTNKNSLKAELLNKAIELPLQSGLQLPGLNILQLGAVNQYASAAPTNAAVGASGAVSNSGGVGLGGSDAPPAGAKLDLSGLGGADLAKLLNVQAAIGAVSAGAVQGPASGTTSLNKNCGDDRTVTAKNSAQSGTYCIAGANLTLSLPILGQILPIVENAVDPILTTLDNGLKSVTALIPNTTISIPTLSTLLADVSKIDLDNGITVDLNTGVIKVDLEALIEALTPYTLNTLPVDTSLVPYILTGLADLPAKLSATAANITTVLNGLLADVKVTAVGQNLTSIIAPVLAIAGQALTSVLTPLTSGLSTITTQTSAITDLLAKLLDVVVNDQSTTKSGGLSTFTQTALQVKIGSGLGLSSVVAPIISALGSLLNGSLPTPTAKTLATKTAAGRSSLDRALATAKTQAKALAAKAQSGAKTTRTVKSDATVSGLKINAAAAKPAAAAVQDVLVSLNLAQASVTGSVGKTPATTSPTPTPSTSVPGSATPSTSVPTGIPAGAGTDGGSPTLPLVLILLTVGLAAGGVVTYRIRGARGLH